MKLPKGATRGRPILISANTEQLFVNQDGPTPGQTCTLDSGRLRNIFRTPIAITELRFTYGDNQTSFGVPTFGASVGGYVYCQLAVGPYKITPGFVPLWAFCRRYTVGSEMTGYYDGESTYRCVLPRPLIIPPNMSFEADFQVDPTAAPTAGDVPRGFDLEMSAMGFTLEGNNIDFSYADIPFISSYNTTPAPVTAGTTPPKNSEINLKNPFMVPLTVHRLTGRIAAILGIANGAGSVGVFAPLHGIAGAHTTVDAGISNEAGVAFQISLQDSNGYYLTNKPTPFSYLLYSGAEWTFNRVLQPRQSYYATITGAFNGGASNPGSSISQPFDALRYQVALVGSRKERIG